MSRTHRHQDAPIIWTHAYTCARLLVWPKVDKQKTKGSSTGLWCNEGRLARRNVSRQSFLSHCRTKGTSHQLRVIRGFHVAYRLTERNLLCHRGRLWPQSGPQRQSSPSTGASATSGRKEDQASGFSLGPRFIVWSSELCHV